MNYPTIAHRAAAIATIYELEQQLRDTHKQADCAVEHYQQEKNRLIQLRTEANDQVRDIKLQYENTISQLRQHSAKTERELRRELEIQRRKWLNSEEPRPKTSANTTSYAKDDPIMP
jgi:hypothetical protein